LEKLRSGTRSESEFLRFTGTLSMRSGSWYSPWFISWGVHEQSAGTAQYLASGGPPARAYRLAGGVGLRFDAGVRQPGHESGDRNPGRRAGVVRMHWMVSRGLAPRAPRA